MYDTEQVAAILNISERQVYRLKDAGDMPQPGKLGRCVRWPRDVIDEWIAAGCPSCRTPRRPR